MARWRIESGPPGQPPTSQLSQAGERKLSFSLADPSTLGFSIDARSDQALDVLELATDVHATRDDRILYTGRVLATEDDISDSGHSLTASCTDVKGLLARRFLPDAQHWVDDDAASLWQRLLVAAQTFPNSDLGIAVPLPAYVGTTITEDIESGANILAELQKLAGPEEAGSVFDWDVTPGWVGRTAQFWPRRGRDLSGRDGVVLDYLHRPDARGRIAPRASAVAGLKRAFDPATYANAALIKGGVNTIQSEHEVTDEHTGAKRVEEYSYDVPTTPVAVRDGISVADIGTWGAVESYPDVKLQPQLNRVSRQRALALSEFAPTYDLTLTDGWWRGPDHIWLGDTVRLLVDSGRVREDVALRVSAVGIDLDDDGQESISLTVGPTRRTALSTLLAHTRRIALLERTR